ncbi:hypothetical protein JCM3770_003281 [Rhodotorula araucariae]
MTITLRPLTPHDIRLACRTGAWKEPSTAGVCEGHVQANLVVLPAKYAADFRALCARNPVPCPLLGETKPGDPLVPPHLANDCDIRTDAPAYNVYKGGNLVATKEDILDDWADDSVGFLIGCSFSCEAALTAGGLTPRQIEIRRNVPMYKTKSSPATWLYLRGFFKGFDDSLGKTSAARVEFMTSEGTLVDVSHFSGLRSILSGPAGGVVGYSLTSWDEKKRVPVIGFDMGGTSSDVSRFDGKFEKTYETSTAGVSIQTPQLDIHTVAAGGGSCLTFRNGLFHAGPGSAGAEPGPAASVEAFEVLRAEINAYNLEHGSGSGKTMSLDEVAFGFIKVANEIMARPIRALTEARGFSTSKHILAAFGGAGGQHACELARTLGITQIPIRRYSSIPSAYGMALSNRAFDRSEPCAAEYTEEAKPAFITRLDRLKEEVVDELRRQGFADDRIEVELYLNMRYDGSDTSLMTLAPADGTLNFGAAFETAYKNEFGFLLDAKATMVDDTAFSSADVGVKAEKERASMYFEQTGRVGVPVYKLANLVKGDLVRGPGAIVDGTQTLILDPGAEAKICSRHVYITLA